MGYLRSLAVGKGILYAANESRTVTALRGQDDAVLWKEKIEASEVEMAVVG